MIKLKNKWLVYKNLMMYLVLNQNKDNSRFSGIYRSIKFEIKLYLLALSFNRFLFNFDKILFVLCIVTNFLYYISLRFPRVLFFGEYNEMYEIIIKKAARMCNQIYYSKCLLPGSIVNIEPIDPYYERFGNSTFPKHLDCVFLFFCSRTPQELQEISTLGIPIVGLVEFNAANLQNISHPIICVKDMRSIYFFSNYFSKILNSYNCNNKSKIYFKHKNFKKINAGGFVNNNAKRLYSVISIYSKLLNYVYNNSKQYNVIYNNFFLYNLITCKNIIKISNNNLSVSPIAPVVKNLKLFFKQHISNWHTMLFKYIKFRKMKQPSWVKRKKKYDFNKKNLSFKLKRKTITLRIKKLTTKQRKKLRRKVKLNNFIKDVKKSAKQGKSSIIETFNFKSWSIALRRTLKSTNIYGNRSLTERDKRFFLRDYIISDLRTYGITTRLLKLKNQIIVNKFPFIGKFVKKIYVPKAPTPLSEVVGSWAYRKSRLFTVTELPKKRKRIKRLKLFWKLRWLIKLQKRGTMRRYIYTKRVRASIIKKKILVRKMIKYYYNFSFSKKVNSLVVFSKKLKNKTTTSSGLNMLNVFESHLAVFIMRSKFVSNMLDSKALITSGKVLVNGIVIYNPGYILNRADIVQIKPEYFKSFYKKYIKLNKPARWRKNRYFYRLSTKNRSTQIFKNKRSFFKISILRKYRILLHYKFFWKKRNYPVSLFIRHIYNVITHQYQI